MSTTNTEQAARPLNDLLESYYLAMVDAFVAAGIHLDARIYEKIIPEQVLILAAELGHIPTIDDPSEALAVQVGRWFIDPQDRDQLLESLASVITLVRATETVATDDEPPTPSELIDRLLEVTGWQTIERLSKELSTSAPGEQDAYRKFLERLYQGPNSDNYFERRIVESTEDRRKALLNLMRSVSPEFGSLTIDNLRWR
jgi:hypothetical protein